MKTNRLLPCRPLPDGGTIGLCSPAGPSPKAAIEDAEAVLIRRGYRVVIGRNAAAVDATLPYLAGDDAARAGDLNALLRDPAVDLILCARGGYGTMRLLDRIDYAAARADPKPVVGYSDITALSLALAAKAGVASFSGIMATAGHGIGESTLDPFSEASLWAAVRGEKSITDERPWTVHRGAGTVSGTLYPVCLTLLAALVGTPFLPDLRGAILLIEDVHESLYAVDRALAQLRLAGLLDTVAAVLIGSFNGMTEEEDAALARGVPDLVLSMTPPSVPVVSGVAYGHIARRLTLPVGLPVTADASNGTFRIDV